MCYKDKSQTVQIFFVVIKVTGVVQVSLKLVDSFKHLVKCE